jgi:hypothetical protein
MYDLLFVLSFLACTVQALTELTCMKQDAARSKEQFDTRQAEATDMKVAVAQVGALKQTSCH